MAKKKNQNIVITDKELTPSIIGKLDTKQKSPAILIIIFFIFIAVVLFLPDIQTYVENYLSGNNSTINKKPNENNNPVDGNENSADNEEIVYYDYTSDLSITHESFTIFNIKVLNNHISFELKNNTNNVINLEDNKYYLEIYSSDTTLIQRIKISYGSLAPNSAKSYTYDLDESVSNSLAKLLVATKTEADYPEVVLNTDESGIATLVCNKGYETITYTFGNLYLTNISDVVNYPASTDSSYNMALQNYQIMATAYDNIEGVSSTIVPLTTGFTFTTIIDLSNADITSLENKNYYNYKTLAKTVKFETESNGFSCN